MTGGVGLYHVFCILFPSLSKTFASQTLLSHYAERHRPGAVDGGRKRLHTIECLGPPIGRPSRSKPVRWERARVGGMMIRML